MSIYKNKISTVRSLPKNLNFKDLHLFEKELVKNISISNYRFLKNIFIVKNTIFKPLPPYFYIKDTFFERPTLIKIIKDTMKNIIRSEKKISTIDKASWILDNKSTVYFHFICDSLTRAVLIDERIKDYPVLLTHDFIGNNFVYEFLDYLEIPYIQMENKYYYIKDLLITPHTAPSGNYDPKLIKKLSYKFTKNNTSLESKNKRIWIDRKNERRDVKNLEEVKKILKKFNFEIVNFKDYSVLEKINLLGKTEYLMGAFGSGLTNMLMLPSSSKLIELRKKGDSHNNAFFSLSSELDLPYYYFEVDIVGHITHGQVDIDIIKFESFLNSIFK